MVAFRIAIDPRTCLVVPKPIVWRRGDDAMDGFVRQRRPKCEAITMNDAYRTFTTTSPLIAGLPTSLGAISTRSPGWIRRRQRAVADPTIRHVADLTKVAPEAVLWQFRRVVGKENRQCNMRTVGLAPLT